MATTEKKKVEDLMWKDEPSKKNFIQVFLHGVQNFSLLMFLGELETGISKVNGKGFVSAKQLWFTWSLAMLSTFHRVFSNCYFHSQLRIHFIFL